MSPRYRLIFTAFVTWIRQSLSFVWLMALAAYLCASAGQAMYRNYQAQQDTKALQAKLREARLEKEHLEVLLAYYHTDSFKEKELRRTLLMKRPNEKVYALPESDAGKEVESLAKVTAVAQKPQDTQPIWRQWIRYVLNQES